MHPKFIRDEIEFQKLHDKLKLKYCPFCNEIATLICHGFLKGYNEYKSIINRAHRIYCSNRNNKRGCGRTFSIFFSKFIKQLRIGANTAWDFLKNILNGQSIEESYNENVDPEMELPFEACYYFWSKLRKGQHRIRTNLLNKFGILITEYDNPVKEVIHYLNNYFTVSNCSSISIYQEIFQESFV